MCSGKNQWPAWILRVINQHARAGVGSIENYLASCGIVIFYLIQQFYRRLTSKTRGNKKPNNAQFVGMRGANRPVFFDRGVLDQVGYAMLFGIDCSAAERASKVYRCNTQAFFAPAWEEIYQQDEERRMTFQQARSFGAILKQTYVRFGYQVVEIPCISPARRAEFVLDHLTSTLS